MRTSQHYVNIALETSLHRELRRGGPNAGLHDTQAAAQRDKRIPRAQAQPPLQRQSGPVRGNGNKCTHRAICEKTLCYVRAAVPRKQVPRALDPLGQGRLALCGVTGGPRHDWPRNSIPDRRCQGGPRKGPVGPLRLRLPRRSAVLGALILPPRREQGHRRA